MNRISHIFRRMFRCPFGNHVIHLSREELQLINNITLKKACKVCGMWVNIEPRNDETYWEVEDDIDKYKKDDM